MRIPLLVLSLVAFTFGAEYTTNVSSLYKEGSSKVIGRLLPTVEVKNLGKVGDKNKLEFSGYIQDGVENAIYYVPSRRILVAGMSKGTKYDYEVLETLKDGGKTWKKIKVQLLSNATDFTQDENSLYKKAEELYSNNCALCHAKHDIKHYTANQWPSILNSMLSRTAIPKAESYLVIQYLQKNAKDMPWQKK